MIYTGEVTADGTSIEVLCEHCREPVGWLSRAECSELTVKSVEVICNECDNIFADEVPPQLIPGENEAIFIFGPERTTILADRPRTAIELLSMIMLERVHPRLSSSPYVKETKRNRKGVGRE